jgi:hypothetical protein
MPADTKEFVADSFKQAADAFAKSMHAGIRFQEDTAQFWTEIMGRTTEELRVRWDKFSHDVAPFSRRAADRLNRLFDEQSHRGLELMRKSFDLWQARTANEAYDKTMALWQASFNTMRDSSDALVRTNAELLDGWSQTVRSVTGAPEGKGPVKGEPKTT